jgi:hypothetical protein
LSSAIDKYRFEKVFDLAFTKKVTKAEFAQRVVAEDAPLVPSAQAFIRQIAAFIVES